VSEALEHPQEGDQNIQPAHWSAENLETAMCPLCGPTPGVRIRYDFHPFKVVVCLNCTLHFLSPRLAEKSILKLYQSERYYQSTLPGRGYDEYFNVRQNWLKTYARRLRRIQKYRPVGRVLDVGCGAGYFMEAAVRLGYDVWGIDASAYIVELARERFGARVRQGTIDSNNFENQSFDVVGAFDTFEHIYQPIKFLDAARELLKPRGVLAMTTPDITSRLARVSGRRWVSFKIPEHVFYWSPKTIREAMKGRFEVLEIRKARQYASLSFLARRVFGWGPVAPGPLKLLLNGLSRFSIYADNGSLTVLAMKQ
jgi:2-polyprenyl-3-methyl-5-hydroxy-6-metoxy-1,4-benzoquinol methylase